MSAQTFPAVTHPGLTEVTYCPLMEETQGWENFKDHTCFFCPHIYMYITNKNKNAIYAFVLPIAQPWVSACCYIMFPVNGCTLYYQTLRG